MRRRTLLKGMAGAAVSATASTAARARGRQRNVLLLISDDQGLDLGCYGTPVATPRLDGLARVGTRFSHAFAAVSSCSPSRAVIHTGLYGHQNGMYGLQHDVHHQSLLDGIETLPSLLSRAGYATALVGKKHIGPDSAFPFEAELVPERSGIRDVREMAVAAASFIRSTNDRPFFVTVAYSDPHRAATDYGNDRPWPGVKPVTYDPAKVHIPSHLPDLPDVRRDLAEYYESLSRLDTGVGMLLDLLAESGRADDTLVVFATEFGRTAYSQGGVGDPSSGRDHHGRCFTVWLAGGGVKGGMEYGSTDDFCYNITANPVHLRDFHATILHCLGIDHQRLTFPFRGLDAKLTGVEKARVVTELLA